MSNKTISLIVKAFSWTVMGVSIVMAALFFLGFITEEPYIVLAYVLVAIAALLAVVFPVFFFAQAPKKAIKALGGLVALGVIFAVGFFMADSTPIVSSVENPDFSNANVLIYSDAGIYATYLLFGVAVAALLFTGIRSIFNR